MTRCSIIKCACLNFCVLCSKTLVGALMKLAAIQNDISFSVIKVDEACPSEFGLDVKLQLRFHSKYECFCLSDRIEFGVPPSLDQQDIIPRDLRLLCFAKRRKLHHYCGIAQPSMQ